MFVYEQEIKHICKQIEELFHPAEVILFGSCAKGVITRHSDIDLCVVMETENKRAIVQQILLEIECERDLDVVIYTPEEWAKYASDTSTFAYKIFSTGVRLSGRH